MQLKVDTLPGVHGDLEPHVFFIGETRFAVAYIIDRWIGQNQNYFKLMASDGAVYILRHMLETDEWELTLYQAVRQDP